MAYVDPVNARKIGSWLDIRVMVGYKAVQNAYRCAADAACRGLTVAWNDLASNASRYAIGITVGGLIAVTPSIIEKLQAPSDSAPRQSASPSRAYPDQFVCPPPVSEKDLNDVMRIPYTLPEPSAPAHPPLKMTRIGAQTHPAIG